MVRRPKTGASAVDIRGSTGDLRAGPFSLPSGTPTFARKYASRRRAMTSITVPTIISPVTPTGVGVTTGDGASRAISTSFCKWRSGS